MLLAQNIMYVEAYKAFGPKQKCPKIFSGLYVEAHNEC